MKDLKEIFITEAQSSWKPNRSGVFAKGLDLMNVDIRPDKEYGFIAWDEDSETVSLIAADSIDALADGLSVDPEQFEDIFKLKVGQVDHDIVNNTFTMRIW